MAMISKETLKDYMNRTASLCHLFMDNLSKADDLVVKDSPVDYVIHQFIRSVLFSIIRANFLLMQFNLAIMASPLDDKFEMSEHVETFHSLEERLPSQNCTLDKLTEKISDKS